MWAASSPATRSANLSLPLLLAWIWSIIQRPLSGMNALAVSRKITWPRPTSSRSAGTWIIATSDDVSVSAAGQGGHLLRREHRTRATVGVVIRVDFRPVVDVVRRDAHGTSEPGGGS